MATPIFFKITNAGKNAMLDAQNNGITLRLTHVAIGTGKYTPTGNETALAGELQRWVITNGGIEPATHTVRFSSSMAASQELTAYEVGVFTDTGVLFAVASSIADPLVKIYPDITFIASFGLALDDFDVSKITVSQDNEGALSIALMQQHLASPDPHPQYLLKGGGTGTADDLIQRIVALENRKIEPVSVGGLLLTTNNYADGQAVHDGEGYGTWTRYAEGRVPIGVGTAKDINAQSKTFTLGQIDGEYQHGLTVDEMAIHDHAGDVFNKLAGISSDLLNAGYTSIDSGFTSGAFDNDVVEHELATGGLSKKVISDSIIQSVGGNQPHNNIQPFIATGIWLRLPDDYTPASFDIYFTTDAQGLNRVGQINEDSAIYLWIDVTNASMPIAVTKFNQQVAGEFIPGGANLTYPPTINNGKNLMVSVLPKNYHVDMQSIIDWGFNLFDATVGEVRTIHTGLTINNTINDPQPYNGLKFEIRVVNDQGSPRCILKVLENNSPFTVSGLVNSVKIYGIPSDGSTYPTFFTVEQAPVDGISDFKFNGYSAENGDVVYTVFNSKGLEDFRNGLIPDGTLINTVKLTYKP